MHNHFFFKSVQYTDNLNVEAEFGSPDSNLAVETDRDNKRFVVSSRPARKILG